MHALRQSIEAWLTSTSALTLATADEVNALVLRNRALCVWLHADATTDAGVVAAFHALARRLHVCNLHPARPTPLVCVVTSRSGGEDDAVAAALAAHVARLERHRRREAPAALPQLCVFDAVSCERHTVATNTTSAALLSLVRRHSAAAAAADPTLATITDEDVRSAAAVVSAADVVTRYPEHLLNVPEPLAVAAQVFALHTLSAWDTAVDAWATPTLPRAVVWISTAWAPLPAVADILPLPPLDGAVTWPPTVLNDVVAARARALPGSVLLLSTDALDMPQLPFVCGVDLSTGERYVYGQVLALLEQLRRDAGTAAPQLAPTTLRRLELEPAGAWKWPQTTRALRAACGAAVTSGAGRDSAGAASERAPPAAVPWASKAGNVAEARANIAAAAAADLNGVVAALAEAVPASTAAAATLRCVVPPSDDDVGSAEQLITTVCALPVEQLWDVYSVLCGTPLPPHVFAECTPSTRRLRSRFIKDTRTTPSYHWLRTSPFAFGYAAGGGACWPVATLPPHIIQNKTLITDAVTPRPLDAPSITLYFAATRFEQQQQQLTDANADGVVAAALLRARAHPHAANTTPLPPLPLPHCDARPRAAFAAMCRWLGPHPSLWDVRAIVEPPLQMYAAPHRALLSSAAFPVVVFGRDTCGYTQRARAALTDANIPHTYTAIASADAVAPEELRRQVAARRHKTLPCVFVGPYFLGGCDSVLSALRAPVK